MRHVFRVRLVAASAILAGLTAGAISLAQDVAPKIDPAAKPAARDAKPLGDVVKKGLAFLVAQQLPNGGWSQGEESAQMRGNGEPTSVANVGDTCIAALALIRAGHTPKEGGQYGKNVAKAAEYVCAQVEKSSQADLYVTDVRNTRLQGKLGPYVDTFLASLLMAELKGKMGDEQAEKLVGTNLDKVIAKVAKNQKEDGSWANAGWAPVLAQSIAAKGLNRAAQNGVQVSGEVLARVEANARNNFSPITNASTGTASFAGVSAGRALGGPASGTTVMGGAGFKLDGAASVPLYAAAANSAAGQDALNTRQQREADLKKVMDDPNASKDDRDKASGKLKELAEENRKAADAQAQANQAVIKQLTDKQFIAGFGSNGGEEFLSYMQISETLRVKGGKEWEDWDKSMTENLGRIQNPDGSWSGHHCITGRTFCTSAALLVLMADRAPLPVAKEIKDKK
jgi:hypothetical protein